VAADSQTPLPWRLSRSVIDSVGPAGAEFARNDSARLSTVVTAGYVRTQIGHFCAFIGPSSRL